MSVRASLLPVFLVAVAAVVFAALAIVFLLSRGDVGALL